MRDEILICSVDGFLEKLAPFSPDVRWINSAYVHLKEKELLGIPADTVLPVVHDAPEGSNRVTAQEKAEARAVEPEVNAEVCDQR
jgi:hypothetical protein